MIKNMQILMNPPPLKKSKQVMKNLIMKNLHVLSIPWMNKVSQLQGNNPRQKLMKRVANPLKRNTNYLMILMKKTNT
jgi:hypothetical protein